MSHKRNLLFAQAISRPVRKWLKDFLDVVGKSRIIEPAFRDEFFWEVEVSVGVIGGPVGDRHGGLGVLALRNCASRVLNMRTNLFWYIVSIDELSSRRYYSWQAGWDWRVKSEGFVKDRNEIFEIIDHEEIYIFLS